jgi:hypothetical protein
MRKVLFGLAVAAGLMAPLFAMTGPANADPYKWCASYGGADLAATNCGFVTLEQCLETISGVGGSCGLSPFYTEPGKGPAKRKRHRAIHHHHA